MRAVLFSYIMATMIKAVFFDIDGTLLKAGEKELDRETEEALLMLKKRGISIYVASGRHISSYRTLSLLHIPFSGYITLNGQICLDEDFNIIYKKSFTAEASDSLRKLYAERRYPISLMEEDKVLSNYIREGLTFTLKDKSEEADGKSCIYQASIYIGEDISHITLPGCRLTRWSRLGIDVIPEGGGKDIGMGFFCGQRGIRRDEVIAFGDAENDIPMFTSAGISVAMSTASENVKAAATHIEENGIKAVLQKLDLL